MDTTFDTHIEQIVQSIFEPMLGMEVHRSDVAPDNQPQKLLATIHIAGARSMSVVLGVSEGAARASAAAMLQMSTDDVTEDDLRDVIAELANMVGGNLESLMPGPLYLSLPTVVAGRELGLQVPGAELVEEVSLHCDGGPLWVSLYALMTEQ